MIIAFAVPQEFPYSEIVPCCKLILRNFAATLHQRYPIIHPFKQSSYFTKVTYDRKGYGYHTKNLGTEPLILQKHRNSIPQILNQLKESGYRSQWFPSIFKTASYATTLTQAPLRACSHLLINVFVSGCACRSLTQSRIDGALCQNVIQLRLYFQSLIRNMAWVYIRNHKSRHSYFMGTWIR